jgi:hypothetical protein
MTSGGFVVVVRKNYFIESKYLAFFRVYLVTVLKALVRIFQISFLICIFKHNILLILL